MSVIQAPVGARMQDLFERHLPLDESAVSHLYSSDRGAYPLSAAGEERDLFAIAFAGVGGRHFDVGDSGHGFLLQSISKVFAYALALSDRGREAVLERVGVEPSGDSFNSIVFDERSNRPYNPMVNAGALVATSLVKGADADEKLERILALVRSAANNPAIEIDEEAAAAELEISDRNRATAYLMRSEGMIDGDVEELLALYLRQCSIRVTTRDLAAMAATLGNGFLCPLSGEQVLSVAVLRDVLSVMHTCGMYDAAGQWAYEVGLPAKSGVSGGILVAVPGKGGVGVYSPPLDTYGNSVRGVRVCREVSERLGLHLFAAEHEDAFIGAATPREDEYEPVALTAGPERP